MESKIGMVFRNCGETNKNETNHVYYYYKVIGDGFCERIAYRRRKYMEFKKPKIFKFISEQSGKSFDEETQTWIPFYVFDAQDEDSKSRGCQASPYTSRSGVVTYM